MKPLDQPVARRGSVFGEKYRFAEVAANHPNGVLYEHGTDFTTGARSLAAYASQWASRNGYKSVSRVCGVDIEIQFIPLNGDAS